MYQRSLNNAPRLLDQYRCLDRSCSFLSFLGNTHTNHLVEVFLVKLLGLKVFRCESFKVTITEQTCKARKEKAEKMKATNAFNSPTYNHQDFLICKECDRN